MNQLFRSLFSPEGILLPTSKIIESPEKTVPRRLNRLRKTTIPGRARLQPCHTDRPALRASAPEGIFLSTSKRIESPEKTVPRRLNRLRKTDIPGRARLQPCHTDRPALRASAHEGIFLSTSKRIESPEKTVPRRLNRLREADIPGRARLQPCRTDRPGLRALAPEVRCFSMHLQSRGKEPYLSG